MEDGQLEGEGLVERRGQPFLVAVGLLRARVCDATTWASWKVAADASSSSSSDEDDDVPLAEARFRARWALPSNKRDAIVSTIDNEFKDGLYTDDTNVPEGRLRDEARSEPASSDEEGEEPAAVVAGGRAGRHLDM